MASQLSDGRCNKIFHSFSPYIAMISLQFGYAGMNIITKLSLNHGMSHYVLVVYRHAIAALSIAPFALVLERKVRPKITFTIFMQIFGLGLLGPVIDQNMYYAGLKITGPTFSCAMSNMLPAMTFIMAVIFRMEKVVLKKVIYQAKLAGTLVTVAGAMLMTLYKGPIVELFWTKHMHTSADAPAAAAAAAVVVDAAGKKWVMGCIYLIIATLAWAFLFVLQAATVKNYSAQLSLTTWVCSMGTLQAIVVTLVMEKNNSSAWRIGWDVNLLAAAYAGIVTSSIAYYVQGRVIEKKGPVFASAFSPLMMIVVAVMGSFILAEKIYLGGVIGAVLIVGGLYSVLWGKHKESKEKKEKEAMALPMAMASVDAVQVLEGDEVEMKKKKEMSSSSVDSEAAAVAESANGASKLC